MQRYQYEITQEVSGWYVWAVLIPSVRNDGWVEIASSRHASCPAYQKALQALDAAMGYVGRCEL
jgi:hypothetical protein